MKKAALIVAVLFVMVVAGLMWLPPGNPVVYKVEGEGDSMQGFARDGQNCMFVRTSAVDQGDVVHVYTPSGPSIKRVERVDGDFVFLTGDNPDCIDSRTYGAVDASNVEGICLVRLPAFFDSPRMDDPTRDPIAVEVRAEARFKAIQNRALARDEVAAIIGRGDRIVGGLPKSVVDGDTEVGLQIAPEQEVIFNASEKFSKVVIFFRGEMGVLRIGDKSYDLPAEQGFFMVEAEGAEAFVINYAAPGGYLEVGEVYLYPESPGLA